MSTNTTATPPAAAVAADSHWSAKLARLRDRKPLEQTVTFHDGDAQDAVTAAGKAVNLARRSVRSRVTDRALAALDEEREELTADEERDVTLALDLEPEVVEALQVLEDAKQTQTDLDVSITLRGLPGDVYEALMLAHPATKQQRDDGETAYNVNRFAPALIAASCVDPMTAEDAAGLIGGEFEILDDDGEPTGKWGTAKAVLNQGESALLYQTAVAVNANARVSLGKG